MGIIPEYGISPDDGTLRGGTFFYKDLRKKRGAQPVPGKAKVLK